MRQITTQSDRRRSFKQVSPLKRLQSSTNNPLLLRGPNSAVGTPQNF